MTFEERRNALIQADRTYAQDWHSITSTLSPSERKLSSLLKSLVGDLSDKLQECHPDRLHPAQQPITHLISTMRELNHPLWHIITTVSLHSDTYETDNLGTKRRMSTCSF